MYADGQKVLCTLGEAGGCAGVAGAGVAGSRRASRPGKQLVTVLVSADVMNINVTEVLLSPSQDWAYFVYL